MTRASVFRLILLGAATFLAGTACVFGHRRPARANVPLVACRGDTAVYAAGDTGVTPARPTLPLEPPLNLTAPRITAEGIVETDGTVRHTRVVVSGGAAADSQLVSVIRRATFHPAVRAGCMVRFAMPVTVTAF
jgi:hypothetical protein